MASDAGEHGGRAVRGRERPPPSPPTYGRRERFGPYHRQAVRLAGRTLERFGAWLDSWSWGWRG